MSFGRTNDLRWEYPNPGNVFHREKHFLRCASHHRRIIRAYRYRRIIQRC